MIRTLGRLTALLFVALATTRALHAQAPVPSTEPLDSAKRALVAEFVEVANFRSQLLRTMRESSKLQSAMPLPPGFWERFLARAEQDANELLAPIAEDYGKYLSSDELRAMIAFYRSPIGRRFIEVGPIISARSSFVGQQWGARVGMQVASELAQTSNADAKPAKPVSGKKP
jgi:uncharacterized protein